MNKNLLSVIVCVYNEERTIEKLIKKVEDSKLPDNFSKEIIIIDNCSTDKTKIILKKFINKKNFTIKLQNKNYGKGSFTGNIKQIQKNYSGNNMDCIR